ncbi:MAG: winged helix-turn-helix domain-containing protein [Patescibacteria group bacterium]|jgi:DNA-binding MarR family transcriptional regulator
MKTGKQLERYFKGAANHRRLEILLLINKRDGITVEQIAEALQCNIKTISEHTRRLVHAGLVNKVYQGRSVAHSLSPYGKRFVAFIKTFSHSPTFV